MKEKTKPKKMRTKTTDKRNRCQEQKMARDKDVMRRRCREKPFQGTADLAHVLEAIFLSFALQLFVLQTIHRAMKVDNCLPKF